MKKSQIAFDRYKSVIIADKSRALPRDVLALVEREVAVLLSHYFDVKTVSAQLDYDKDGNLWLTVESAVLGIKPCSPRTLPSLTKS